MSALCLAWCFGVANFTGSAFVFFSQLWLNDLFKGVATIWQEYANHRGPQVQRAPEAGRNGLLFLH
jgi:hypothetical protein